MKSIPDIWEAKTPSLGSIRKAFGEDYALAYLELWIVKFVDSINTSTKMSPNQIKDTALLVISEMPYITIADISFVFREAMKGAYGDVYNRVDCMVIYKWFTTHWNNRLNEAEQSSLMKHGDNVWNEKGKRNDF